MSEKLATRGLTYLKGVSGRGMRIISHTGGAALQGIGPEGWSGVINVDASQVSEPL